MARQARRLLCSSLRAFSLPLRVFLLSFLVIGAFVYFCCFGGDLCARRRSIHAINLRQSEGGVDLALISTMSGGVHKDME